MITKSENLPEWLNEFAEKVNPKKDIDENKVSVPDAEQMGFFASAEYLGRDTFEVKADIGEFFDSGSIWYIEKDDSGADFLMKQTDDSGVVIRRMSDLKKKAEAQTCEENRKPIIAFLDYVASNLNGYDLEKVKKEVNDIEDNVVSEDPLFKKSSSFEIVKKVNAVRDDINTKIAELIEEYEEEESKEEDEEKGKKGESKEDLEELRKKELEAVSSVYIKKEVKVASAKPKAKKEKNESPLSETIHTAKLENTNTKVDVLKVLEGESKYPYRAIICNNGKYGYEEKFKEEETAIKFAEKYISKKLNASLKKESQELKITEELFDDAANAQTKLEEYKTKPEGSTDIKEYEIKQDVEGGTGKFKVYEKMASYYISAGRIHKGKVVRVFQKEGLGATSVIKCMTPDCVHNFENQCMKRMVKIEGNMCADYEQNAKEIEAFNKMVLSSRDEEAEMEKQIPIESIEEAEDIEVGDGEQTSVKESEPEKEVDIENKMADVKSEIWEQVGNEAIDEFLDIDETTSAMYNKIIAGLEIKLGDGDITEEEYNNLLDDLEELKDDDILKEYLQEELLVDTEGEKVEKEKEKKLEMSE